MITEQEAIRDEVKRITNELRIATTMAKLKREQAERADERLDDLTKQLASAMDKLEGGSNPAPAEGER